jgi:hypothetical protein
MTDPLAERFLTLAEADDGPDWRDVRRRAQRPRGIVFVVVIAVAAIVAAAALSAGQTWVFGSHWGQPTANRTVTLHGRTYTLRISLLDANGHFFALLLYGNGPHARELTAVYNGAIIPAPGQQIIPKPDAVSAVSYTKAGGEIWYGDTRPDVRRVVVVDTHGHAHSTDTVAAPKTFASNVRFWAVALESGFARTLVAYDGDGNEVERRRIYSMMRYGG